MTPTSAHTAPHHRLPATPSTVHWGFFSRALPPILTVDSGDIVTIDTLTHCASHDADRMIHGDPDAEAVFRWTRDGKAIERRGAGAAGSGEGLGSHILTGPVAIRGAKPGDVLEVRILDVRLRPSRHPEHAGHAFGSNAAASWGYHYHDLLTEPKPREVVTIYEVEAEPEASFARAVYSYRWTPQTDPYGVRHDRIDYPGLPVDPDSISRTFGILRDVRVPIRPHFGTMGVAPDSEPLVSSTPPSHFGGNVDNWRVGKGATMYYPVLVPGALFSVGDPHASQGDSELCGTAIECSLTGTFQFILHKQADLAGTVMEGLDSPLLETASEWMVHGFTFPNYLASLGPDAARAIAGKGSLDGAMRDAFRKMRKFLMTYHRLSEDEAISLMSIAVDFGVTQVVDANFGIHAILPKTIFQR